jgi:purine nucleosidase
MLGNPRLIGLLGFLCVLLPVTVQADEPQPARQLVSLIFDTDMGNDIDDALALGLIHSLQSLGECKLLAVTVTKDNRYAGPYVDIVNTFYGRGHIPIGVVRGGVTPDDGAYLRKLATAADKGRPRYPHRLQDGREAPEATGLLRKALAAEPDGSVVVVQVGFSTNLARLLDSKSDDASPLDGTALVKRKVRLLSVMAGKFGPTAEKDRYQEYNVVNDVKPAQQLCRRWPAPIVFSGIEVGEMICYPARSIEQDYNYVAHHPLAEAYRLLVKMPCDRPTWDLTSVLYAVRPGADDFGLSPPGRVTVDDAGVTHFQPEAGGPHRYLTVDAKQAQRILREFVLLCPRQPDAGARPQ